jgi:hypothetical protein
MKKSLIVLVSGMLFAVLVVLAIGQIPPPVTAKYQPTESQRKDLLLAHKDAEIAMRDVTMAQQTLQIMQQRYQGAMDALKVAGEKVKTDNKWPEGVTFEPNSMTFMEPPPPPAPAKKEDPPKP